MYWVMTHNKDKRSKWMEIFDRDIVPVAFPIPDHVCDASGNERHVFNVDVARLNLLQLRKLAKHATPKGGDFWATLRDIRDNGYMIGADDCYLVTADVIRPSFSLGWAYA